MIQTPPVPKVGDEIYVDTHWYMDRGREDRDGGLAKVTAVEVKFHTTWVYVEEFGRDHPENWAWIGPRQTELRQEYGKQRARRTPDDHPSANPGWS